MSHNLKVIIDLWNRIVLIDFQFDLGVDEHRLVEFAQSEVVVEAAAFCPVFWIWYPFFAKSFLCALVETFSFVGANAELPVCIVSTMRREENYIGGYKRTAAIAHLDCTAAEETKEANRSNTILDFGMDAML